MVNTSSLSAKAGQSLPPRLLGSAIDVGKAIQSTAFRASLVRVDQDWSGFSDVLPLPLRLVL
jgi:hypothetical protein